MATFPVITISMTVFLFFLLCFQIRRLSKQAPKPKTIATQTPHRSSLKEHRNQFRERKPHILKPEQYIQEYVTSMLGGNSEIASSQYQAQQWVSKFETTNTPKAYPCAPTEISNVVVDVEEWVFVENERTAAFCGNTKAANT